LRRNISSRKIENGIVVTISTTTNNHIITTTTATIERIERISDANSMVVMFCVSARAEPPGFDIWENRPQNFAKCSAVGVLDIILFTKRAVHFVNLFLWQVGGRLKTHLICFFQPCNHERDSLTP